MNFTGVFLNSAGVLLAGIFGNIFKKGISEKLKNALMTGLGLCVLYIGIAGIASDMDVKVLVISMSVGICLGEWINIDCRLRKLGEWIQLKLPVKEENIANGFITATLFVCVGAMSIVGGIESGTKGTYDTFLAKTFIDSIVVFIMAATEGIGCCLAAFAAFIYQAAITLSAGAIAQIVNDTVISQMSATGSLLIIAIACNLLGITKIKIGNYILAPFIPVVIYGVQQIIS